jgi:PAS domain S-box-containing protein
MTVSLRSDDVFVAGSGDADFLTELARELQPAGVVFRTFDTPADAADEVSALLQRGERAPGVVALQGSGAPVAARAIQTQSPATQLIFPVSWEDRGALQRELRLANVRRGWSFALPEATAVAESVLKALDVSGEQRLVRTTLDRRDARVAAEQIDAQRVRDLVISDALLASILRDAGDAIIATDDRGRIMTANPAATRLFDRPDDDLRSLPIGDVIPSLADLTAFTGRGSEHHIACPDGSSVPVDVSVSRVVLPAGPAGYVIIARDARERIGAEQELRRQAELTSTILDGIGDGVYVTDAFGNLRFMNPAAEAILGWTREELVERNIHETIHSDAEEGVPVPPSQCPLLGAIRTGTPLRTDREFFTAKDGTRIPVGCVVTPVRLEGEVIGGVFNFHDLTPQHSLQEQLRAEKESLAQMNRAKDDFLATISHELRTPITAILGWLQLVSRGELEKTEMLEAFDAIETSARTQAQIVNDLLDVSRVISGKLHLSMQVIDLNEVAMTATAALRPSADAKRITLVCERSSQTVAVCGDPSRLHQIVWNLVSNGVKFTQPGGEVRVIVSSDRESARLVVSDTGVGIPVDLLPTLFEQYRQASDSMKKGGLGLGLAIVRNLVERHGGGVSIASAGLNQGTTVTVKLPLQQSNDDCSARSEQTAS